MYVFFMAIVLFTLYPLTFDTSEMVIVIYAFYLKNLKVTALLENGMYYIPWYVCILYNICIAIMHASYV